jgi:uncharacterized protein YjdB
MRLVNWRSVAIAVAGFGLAACGDDVSVVQPPSALTVNPGSVSCSTGQTVAIGSSLSPTVTGATFAYQASGTGITVTGNGSTATILCSTAGAYSVTVTANGQTVTVPVNVTQGSGPVTGIIIAPTAATVAVGGTTTLSATLLGTGTLPAARFRSAQPAIATVDSVSGVVRGIAPGVATIIASPAGNTTLSAAATVTVLPANALIQSITVTPNPITLQTGQTQQLGAQVQLQANAPTNTARTVTYTSANNAVATVSATGLVTGVSNGTTSIIVRSTADTSFQQIVPVTVRDPAPVRITIANVTSQITTQLIDITQPIGTGAVGANQTGSIFVTLNLDPGDATVRRVDVFLAPSTSPNDTTNRVCSQVFTATQADAFRLALQTGSADVQPITCPINLAAFDTTTGLPGIRNGTAVLRARVTGSFPGQTTTGTSQIAQFVQTLQINNRSGFFVRVTNTPDSAQAAVNARGTAQGIDGRNWVAGSLRFSILGVQFDSAATGNNQTDSIRVQLIDAGPFAGSRALSAIAPASGATIITFPGRTATQPRDAAGANPGAGTNALGNVSPRSFDTANQNIDGYTSGPTGTTIVISGVGFNTTNASNVLTATVNGQTQVLSTGTGNQIPGSFTLNIDNQAPQAATAFNITNTAQQNTFTLTPNGFVGFIGGAFNVNDPTQSTFANRNFGPSNANCPLLGNAQANGDFCGVDRVSTTFLAALNANLTSLTTANVFAGGTAFANGGTLAAANSNTAYSAIARFVDVLGNARNQLVQNAPTVVNGQVTAAGTALTFGVDLSAPTISVANATDINGVVVNASNQGSANNSVSLSYSDDIGFGALPIQILGTRQARPGEDPTAAVRTYCFTGVTGGAATFNALSTTETGLACAFVSVAGQSAIQLSNTLTGQYELTIRTRDQAGNLSANAVVTRYVDVIAPTVQGISLPQTLTGNAPAQFTTGATDNLELGQAYGQVGYAAAPATLGTGNFTIAYTQSLTQLGSPFGAITASVNNSIPINVPSFIRSVTFTNGGVPGAVSTANLAQTVTAVVTDAALAPNAQANQGATTLAIPAGNIAQTNFGATIFATGNQTSAVNNFALSFNTNSTAFPTQLSLGGTTNAPTSGTFSVATQGQVNAFINPFVRVELYYSQAGGPAVYQFLGTAPVGIVTDVPANFATGRTITSNFVFTPLGSLLARGVTSTTSLTYNVIAVGITANGDALVSTPTQVTIIQ